MGGIRLTELTKAFRNGPRAVDDLHKGARDPSVRGVDDRALHASINGRRRLRRRLRR